MNRIGLICSGGGAVMAAAHDILVTSSRAPDWAIVTDRACATEDKAQARGIPLHRVEYRDVDQFSRDAANWLFDDKGCVCTILLFTRLVGDKLFAARPCINLHPSLLPLFPGLGALSATQASGMRIMGATAHHVDQSVDGGPIVAQVWSPRPDGMQAMQRLSFAQKLYLLLVLQERLGSGPVSASLDTLAEGADPTSPVAQPALADAQLEAAFRAFLDNEGIPWPV